MESYKYSLLNALSSIRMLLRRVWLLVREGFNCEGLEPVCR